MGRKGQGTGITQWRNHSREQGQGERKMRGIKICHLQDPNNSNPCKHYMSLHM